MGSYFRGRGKITVIKISKLHGTGVRPVLFLENNKEVLSHKRENKILLTVYYLS